jgi:hypothetical protein
VEWKKVSLSIVSLEYFIVLVTPTYCFLIPYISNRLFYRSYWSHIVSQLL